MRILKPGIPVLYVYQGACVLCKCEIECDYDEITSDHRLEIGTYVYRCPEGCLNEKFEASYITLSLAVKDKLRSSCYHSNQDAKWGKLTCGPVK